MGEFAKRLKNLRLNKHLTQDELAPELGISRSTLGMYETGKREPECETLETIADFFNYKNNELSPEIRAAARGMMELSPEDQKTAIDMINYLSQKGKEAKKD